MHFGALRVFNDDKVTGGMGFGEHSHNNMEIVSIPLKGALEHKDNTGRHKIIKTGDVQIMSAGTGIAHSEYNASKTDEVNFLQIWIMPKARNIPPRYDQKSFDLNDLQNNIVTVVEPAQNTSAVWINQDAWFSLGNFSAGFKTTYTVKKTGNGIFLFMLEGDFVIDEERLSRRDSFGVWDTEAVTLEASTDASVLVIDVPMLF